MLNRFGERNFRYLLAIQRADNMGQAEEFRGRQKEIDRIEAMLDRELEKGSCFSLKQLAGERKRSAGGWDCPARRWAGRCKDYWTGSWTERCPMTGMRC